MMQKFLVTLFFIGQVVASAQLVNGNSFIIIDPGQIFYINDNKQKYEFYSIDFELELINDSIDMKYIKKITLYNGNSSKKFSKTLFLCGLLAGLNASVGDNYPKEFINNIGIATIPMSTIGFIVGYFFPNKESYQISDNDWRFIP